MSNDSNERSATSSSSRVTIFSLLALVGVAACVVFGEWQILSPFSRFLSHSADKAAMEIMPSTLLKQVNDHANKVKNDDDTPKRSIKRIVLLGERHSGTSYTTSMLTKCFSQLDVTDVLVRYKHWFQPTPEYVVNITFQMKDMTTDDMERMDIDIPEDWPTLANRKEIQNAFEDTLVIIMTRNAYDWLEAMREGPHHWPNHFGLFRFPDGPRPDIHGNGRMHEYGVHTFDWKQFVQANMTLSRDVNDENDVVCQHGFEYGTISPCRRSKELYPAVVKRDYAPDMSAAPDYLNFNADNPIYELNGKSHKPFDNPLEFRTAKLQNFLEIPKHWNLGGFMTISYEQVNEFGAEFVLNKISNIVGVDAVCQADPPKHQEHKQMDKEWEAWITEHADWKTEEIVGYKPREASSSEVEEEDVSEATVAEAVESKVQEEAVSEEPVENKVAEAEVESEANTIPQTQVSSNSNIVRSTSFDRIVLLGERHSGTTYTTRMLERCFPDIEVSDFLVRFKHWFQPTPTFVANTTKSYLKNDIADDEGEDMYEIHNQWPNIAALKEPKTAFKNTLLIVMFRNPYDWLEAMRIGPHHWTNHFSLYRFPRAPVPETTGNPWYGSNFSTWSEFINANMTLTVDDGSQGTILCQNGFLKGTVSPCLKSKNIYPKEVQKDYPNDISEAPDQLPFNAHYPIYELDPNGKPYENPAAFRAAKIQNFLDIPNHWDLGSFMTLQHEEINAKGSGFLLEQVSKILGQEPVCEADPPKKQPAKILNPDWAKWITKNADWETEKKVGYEPDPRAGEEKIQRIVLLGERHSGTSYTTAMLAKCFPKLNVDDFLGRYKHWFQPTPDYMVNVTKTAIKVSHDNEEAGITEKIHTQWPKFVSRDNPKAAFKNTLLIVMFRNAYDWLEAMREGPHHWPNHFETVRMKKGVYEIKSFDWNKFVSTELKLGPANSDKDHICQFAYPFGTVTPCVKSKELYPSVVKQDYASDLSAAPDKIPYNAHSPVYELDTNGKPFEHPLKLRAAKINHFLDIPNQWDLGGFLKLKHEEVNMQGAAFLLEQISKIVGMKPECSPDPPKKQGGKQLESDWSDWITKNADWDTEKKVGYQPRVSTNSKPKGL